MDQSVSTRPASAGARRKPVDRQADAHYRRGLALMKDDRWRDAANAFAAATRRRADNSVYWLNLAHARVKLGDHDNAADAARKAIDIDPDSELGVAVAVQCLNSACRHAEAAALLDRRDPAKITDPSLHFAHGEALRNCDRMADAVQAYLRALRLKPHFLQAHLQLGNAFQRLKMPEEARTCYETGVLLGGQEAELRSSMAFQAQQACRWDLAAQDIERLRQVIELDPLRHAVPFQYLTMPSSRAEQLQSSRAHFRRLYGTIEPLPAAPRRAAGGRIRLGYVSGDFHEHATAYLLVELLERHDRARFEVFVYSYGPDDRSPMRARIAAAADHFVDVREISDRAAAERIRADAIDVAFDAKGYTLNSRNGILAFRPAPVQVNYVAYPGSLGSTVYDYVLGDPIVTPLEDGADYDEQIAQVPDCYQPNDRRRTIGETLPRAAYGLPDTGFVFCSFNNAFKIGPVNFDIWCRLLTQVEGSVLWLYEGNPQAKRNLAREAVSRGVDPARIIWAPHLPLAQHLGRLRHADIVLDTLPYNAHTTASDALWVGVPVITTPGETFASRVAASLLVAAGFPQMITPTLAEYEALALDLARNPQKLRDLRDSLASLRDRCALFDSARYTKALERLVERMVERERAGLPPAPLAAEAGKAG
jgi:predicted O-linked N-acetylglucosamine transferase (SPINDLY family)